MCGGFAPSVVAVGGCGSLRTVTSVLSAKRASGLLVDVEAPYRGSASSWRGQ
jgi:hypothetical protein